MIDCWLEIWGQIKDQHCCANGQLQKRWAKVSHSSNQPICDLNTNKHVHHFLTTNLCTTETTVSRKQKIWKK
jgi:hypothetical protein